MRRAVLWAVLALALGAVPARADDRSDGSGARRHIDGARRQVDFGIQVAERGLWREAAYRWRRAVDIDPAYAAAWNNLAVAHEHSGDFEAAREAYDRAIELDPDNRTIQQNYDLFREINDRTNS